jgi:hypothetical protein
MHSTSRSRDNWDQKVCRKQRLQPPHELVDGTMRKNWELQLLFELNISAPEADTSFEEVRAHVWM